MSLSPALEGLLDKTIQILKNDIIKNKIQILVLQPFIQYLIELIFPYIIIVCVIFGLLIIMMISILYILIVQMNPAVVSSVS
jgi:hypothetical protein